MAGGDGFVFFFRLEARDNSFERFGGIFWGLVDMRPGSGAFVLGASVRGPRVRADNVVEDYYFRGTGTGEK